MSSAVNRCFGIAAGKFGRISRTKQKDIGHMTHEFVIIAPRLANDGTKLDSYPNGEIPWHLILISLAIKRALKHSFEIKRITCCIYRSFYDLNHEIVRPLFKSIIEESPNPRWRAERGWFTSDFMDYLGWI
jgi:hypothetical protein